MKHIQWLLVAILSLSAMPLCAKYNKNDTTKYERNFPKLFKRNALQLEYSTESNPKLLIVVAGKDEKARSECIQQLKTKLRIPQMDMRKLRELLMLGNYPDKVKNKYLIYFLSQSKNKSAILESCDFYSDTQSDCAAANFPIIHIVVASSKAAARKELTNTPTALLHVDYVVQADQLSDSKVIQKVVFTIERKLKKGNLIFNRAEKGTTEYATIRGMIKSSVAKPLPPMNFTKYSLILPGLYLGAREAKKCPELMKSISDVVSVHPNATAPESQNITWTHIPAHDNAQFSLINYFDEAYEAIDSTSKGVLVHCVKGYSRSTTIVIAYLMRKFDVTYNEAYRFVKLHRSVTNPNPGFQKQLKQYEQVLKTSP